MTMWKIQKGNRIFLGGQEDYNQVITIARGCPNFVADYEEEWMDEEEVSCYNCRYRRWTAESFMCMKENYKSSYKEIDKVK